MVAWVSTLASKKKLVAVLSVIGNNNAILYLSLTCFGAVSEGVFSRAQVRSTNNLILLDFLSMTQATTTY